MNVHVHNLARYKFGDSEGEEQGHNNHQCNQPLSSSPLWVAMAARLPLAACIVAFHLCLLLSPSTALRRLSEAESSLARHGVGIRPAYHFLPAKNWQNGT